MASVAVPALDALSLLVVVDNETDTLSSVDDGVPQLPEVGHHLMRVPPDRAYDGHPGTVVFDKLCCACHGFSVLATGRHGAETSSVLFDVGPYADVWLDNARRLGVELAAIDAVFLSHWHFDHSGALPEVVAAIAAARRRADRPAVLVDLHPDRPDRRGLMLPNGHLIMLADEPSFEAVTDAGGELRLHAEAHRVGCFHASGPIERVTDYETGLVGHYTYRGQHGEPDPLIMDERFVAAHVRGRGVSVLSACSHAGVVTACLGAQAAFPGVAIDVVLGGYHLGGKAMEARIEPTVRDLRERIRPRVVAPGHCTGWRAKAAMAGAFAPGAYGPSVVGSSYVLTAAAG